jgi:hypothetical protein
MPLLENANTWRMMPRKAAEGWRGPDYFCGGKWTDEQGNLYEIVIWTMDRSTL